MISIISGIVIKGNQKARQLGFKTANIKLNSKGIISGVYKINVIIDNNTYAGIGTYIDHIAIFESHIFNFEANIYGKKIEVYLLKKIRDNKNFDCNYDLINQIKEDIKAVKKIEIKVLTFGTFDIVHSGHEYYLNSAKRYGNFLITIVGTDINVEKIKGGLPLNNQFVRRRDVEDLGISNNVIIGTEDDPYSYIKEYNISVICLGYDQAGFAIDLQNYIDKANLNIDVIRLGSFNKDIYKSSKLKIRGSKKVGI